MRLVDTRQGWWQKDSSKDEAMIHLIDCFYYLYLLVGSYSVRR